MESATPNALFAKEGEQKSPGEGRVPLPHELMDFWTYVFEFKLDDLSRTKQLKRYAAYILPTIKMVMKHPNSKPDFKSALEGLVKEYNIVRAIPEKAELALGMIFQLVNGWKALSLKQIAKDRSVIHEHQSKHYRGDEGGVRFESQFSIPWAKVHKLMKDALVALMTFYSEPENERKGNWDGVVMVTGIRPHDLCWEKDTKEGSCYIFLDVVFNGSEIGYHGYPVSEVRFKQYSKANMDGKVVQVAYTGEDDASEGIKRKYNK